MTSQQAEALITAINDLSKEVSGVSFMIFIIAITLIFKLK